MLPKVEPRDEQVIKTLVEKGEETGLTFKITYTDEQVLRWCEWLVENFDD